MADKSSEHHPFVSYLESLCADRAALAALRRGLGQPPGSVPDMYRYIIPRLPAETEPWYEEACYLVAALFALYPEGRSTGNMGTHYNQARDPNSDNSALERRFIALLGAHQSDLHFYLRQSISFLRSKEVPINWHQLIRDLLAWSHPDHFVQKKWADAFWQRKLQSEPSVEPSA